jgi:aspartate/methionine/tyrosine aminotransferase
MSLPPFRIEHFFGKYEFTARYMLGSSDAETVTVSDLLALEAESRAQFEALKLGYTEVPGSRAMREAVAAIYRDVSSDDVVVFSCAEECIFVAYHALLGPADHVIVEAPLFESALVLARSTGAQVSVWQRHFEDGWAHDLKALEALVRPNTKMLYIATPSNPLGLLMKPEVYSAVMAMARSRGMTVLCDEVYRELEHDPAAKLPAACEMDDNAISIGSMSKSYGLAGLRLGWLTCRNRALLKKCVDYKVYTTICSSAPSEFLSALALRHRQVLLERNLKLVLNNLQHLNAFFSRHRQRFELVQPNGSPTCFPRFKVDDVTAFCDQLAEKHGVLLVPGSVYDLPQHVRFGFGRSNMVEALAVLEKVLDA